MSLTQWVNLSKNDDFKDKDIDSVDRCGKISIEVEVEKTDAAITYKAKVTPVGKDNVTYNAKERSRNPNFKMEKGNAGIVDTKKLRIDDIRLPAAGGNTYKIEIEDSAGNVVSSPVEVKTKRKLYYQFMHMEDAKGKVKPYALTQMEGHCAKYHIDLSKAGVDKKIPFNKCVNSGRGGRFSHVGLASDVKAKYDLSSPLKRVGCVTVLSNYIGTFVNTTKSVSYSIGGPSNPRISITPGAAGGKTNVGASRKISVTVLTGTQFLWYGLDDKDDLAKTWFIDGAVGFTPNTSSSSPSAMAGQSTPINRADVSVGGSKLRTYGGHQIIDIEVKSGSILDEMLSQSSGTLDFAFELNRIKGFSGGFSWGGAGFALTTCCTKAWFEDKSPSASDVIWNHEIGHRMGMVAYGDKDHSATNSRFRKRPELPDSPPHLYGENRGVNDKGHQGPHCEQGAVTYNASTNRWSGTPGCVLFGATGTSSASSPLDYCSDCTPVARKLDLSF